MNEPLDIRLDAGVAWLTLNRPEALNALSTPLIDGLTGFFTGLQHDEAVRVVVLQAAGRAFCAGMDLKERANSGPLEVEAGLALQRRVSGLILAMRRCPQPIVAIVQGAASGGGFALALASDIRLATPDARFNAAFVRIGLSGCDAGASYFLPRMVGSSVAAELLMTGRFLEAPRALALGLVSQVGPLDELQRVARSLVDDLLHANPIGLRLTKDALNLTIDAPGLEAALALEDRNQVLCARTEGFAAAKAAFLAKRAAPPGR